MPGPPPVFLFGNAFEVLQQNRSYTDSVWVKKYGRFIGYYQGTRPTLLVTDAELIKKILVKDFKHFMNRQKLNFYHEMWNENMFNAFDEKWKKIRYSNFVLLYFTVLINLINVLGVLHRPLLLQENCEQCTL